MAHKRIVKVKTKEVALETLYSVTLETKTEPFDKQITPCAIDCLDKRY